MRDTLQQALEACEDLLNSLPPKSKVGLIAYAKEIIKAVPPATPDTIKAALGELQIIEDDAEVQLPDAMTQAMQMLDLRELPPLRMVVVISDGLTADLKFPLFSELGRRAREKEVAIHSIGYGSIEPAKLRSLYEMSTVSRGTFREANDANSVMRAIETLKRELADQLVLSYDIKPFFDGKLHEFQIETPHGQEVSNLMSLQLPYYQSAAAGNFPLKTLLVVLLLLGLASGLAFHYVVRPTLARKRRDAKNSPLITAKIEKKRKPEGSLRMAAAAASRERSQPPLQEAKPTSPQEKARGAKDPTREGLRQQRPGVDAVKPSGSANSSLKIELTKPWSLPPGISTAARGVEPNSDEGFGRHPLPGAPFAMPDEEGPLPPLSTDPDDPFAAPGPMLFAEEMPDPMPSPMAPPPLGEVLPFGQRGAPPLGQSFAPPPKARPLDTADAPFAPRERRPSASDKGARDGRKNIRSEMQRRATVPPPIPQAEYEVDDSMIEADLEELGERKTRFLAVEELRETSTIAWIQPLHQAAARPVVIRDGFVIGRDPRCDLQLLSKGIQPKHAILDRASSGRYTLRLMSEPNNRLPLADGSHFRIGETEFVFKLTSRDPADHPASICFEILSGPERGRILPLRQGRTYTLGTHPSCDLILRAKELDPRHAYVHIRDRGCMLFDLGSAGGTHVRGASLGASELKPGDEVTMGDIRLLLRKVTAQGPSATAAGEVEDGVAGAAMKSSLTAAKMGRAS
jgi:pSer/pThr/pTyr-binding forkhead associated (FHA) protein